MPGNPLPADEIVFGLDRKTDERSLELFLRLFSKQELLNTLIPLLDDGEIEQVVDHLTTLMRNHLEEKQYHELFLGDTGHHL